MNRSTQQGFDVIGDVHGCVTELVHLLDKLGYQEKQGAYQHAHRKAIFVGDIVDRGAHIRQTLRLIKAMVDTGAAHLVLGNHEINWLNSSTYSHAKGDYLRRHTPRNTHHQQATFRAFAGHDAERITILRWLRTMPLWLELDALRIAHAGWNEQLRHQWSAKYGDSELSDDVLTDVVTKGTLAQETIKAFTCGATIPLPHGYVHTCHDGQKRNQIRAKFWQNDAHTYGDIIFPPDSLPHTIAVQPVAQHHLDSIRYYKSTEKPLIVGHYSLLPHEIPTLLAPNIACVDYTCFTYKQLFCYQYDYGSQSLADGRFVSSV